MKNKNHFALMFPALAIVALPVLLWVIATPAPVQAGGEPIVVIVNGSNPVENLSMNELKKIFLSERSRWDTGKSVAPVMAAAGAPERAPFLKVVCKMSDSDFGKYFLQAAFTGKNATPPKEVASGQAVKATVATSPGAIGFVQASDFHGDGSDGGVKAVKIDGLAAGDAGYKIRM